MNELYPIIRRARRPLLPVDATMPAARTIDEAPEPAGAVPVLVEPARDQVPSTPEPEPLNKRAKGKAVSKSA